jgi:hypothetical protein
MWWMDGRAGAARERTYFASSSQVPSTATESGSFGTCTTPPKAVVIDLIDDRYSRLVVGVNDPAKTAAIQEAIGA